MTNQIYGLTYAQKQSLMNYVVDGSRILDVYSEQSKRWVDVDP